MQRFPCLVRTTVCLLMLVGAPAHAASLDATYATWETLRSPDTSTIRFEDGYGFLQAHPAWPEEKTIRLRTEAAAMYERPARDLMARFCTDYPPISGRGMVACVVAGIGDAATRTAMIRRAWVDGDFSEDEENRILETYDDTITLTEHTARMDRLLYAGKLTPAKRMLARVPVAQRNLFSVRLALLANEKNAPRLVNTLSAAQQRDAGVIFERLRWRARKGDDDRFSLLEAASKQVPYPELWWPMRASVARDAIGKGNYQQALAVITPHGELSGEALADALWLKGWLLLRHKGDAANAYKAFFSLYTSVTTPVSKARAAYWAARAAEKNGNPEIANEWLEKAARHPSVFYGQLAFKALHPKAPLSLPEKPEATGAERQQFERDERVAMIRLLAKRGDDKMRDLFITSLGLRFSSPGQFALLSELASQVGGIAAGVETAKLALRQNIIIIPSGWPRITLPPDLPIEPALTLAITRQESEFNADAKSPADARGLMQLLPSTARHIANKHDLAYDASMIMDPSTNLTLGSLYLGHVIEGFDGSYILGIASYNAGPGNVRKWIAARGMPPKTLHGAIDWIESIPFGETRNYVMRVLENVSIYRTRADHEAILAIDRDLLR